MKIKTILAPAEIARLTEQTLQGWTCVVFDILRATTSIVTAIHDGAILVRPVSTIAQALEVHAAEPGKWLLGGERYGNKIDGFDLGNSPAEYIGHAGKRIVSTTTNGTVALNACLGADHIFATSILNLSATAAQIQKINPSKLCLVCAGTFEDFALEDGVAAGLMIAHFPDAALCDASAAMRHIVHSSITSWENLIRGAKNGKALAAAGREADVEWALRRDSAPTVVFCDERGCQPFKAS